MDDTGVRHTPAGPGSQVHTREAALVFVSAALVCVVVILGAALGVVLGEQAIAQRSALARMCVRVDSELLPMGITRTIMREEDPALDVLQGFLTPDEAAHFITIAEGRFKRSVVVNSKTGQNVQDADRTSSTVFLTEGSADPVIRRVIARAAAVSGVPASHFEQLQVVKYAPGQFYKPHFDYLRKELAGIRRNGQRVVTLFAYLNDLASDETGGGTHFPKANLTIQPKLGTAALWYNMKPRGKDALGVPRAPVEDPTTLHGGQPVFKSVKYGLNIWGRTKPQGAAASVS